MVIRSPMFYGGIQRMNDVKKGLPFRVDQVYQTWYFFSFFSFISFLNDLRFNSSLRSRLKTKIESIVKATYSQK